MLTNYNKGNDNNNKCRRRHRRRHHHHQQQQPTQLERAHQPSFFLGEGNHPSIFFHLDESPNICSGLRKADPSPNNWQGKLLYPFRFLCA